jgi:hypothetical protein
MQVILDLLVQQYLFDVEVLSQPWMYYWLLIPAMSYAGFMGIKWAVLTMPIWVPLSLIKKVRF